MSDAALFTLIFGGLLVLRIVAATVIFLLILPRGDRCPLCDAVTIRVRSPWFGSSLFRLAKRWCLTCGWDGYMRLAPAPTAASTSQNVPRPTAGQPSRTP